MRQCLATLAARHGLPAEWDKETELAAIDWSREKSKRCGRTAFQFAKRHIGRMLLARRG